MEIKLIVRLVLYFIIITIVRIVIDKAKTTLHEEFQTKKEVYCIDRKKFARIYLFVAIGFTILFIIIGCFPSNVQGSLKVIVSALAIICNIFLYVSAWRLYKWNIKFYDDKIVYLHGKVIDNYCYTDFSKVVIDSYGNLLFYKNERKLITINSLEGRAIILDKLKNNGIQIRNKNEMKEFVVEVGGGYKGLSIIVALCAIGLFALCFAFANLGGIVLFFFLMILALYSCMSQLTEKYYISEEGICAVRFMRKRKQLLFSEIKYVQEKHSGSADFIVLFSEKGKEISINKAYKNAYEFEKIVHKNKWKHKQK